MKSPIDYASIIQQNLSLKYEMRVYSLSELVEIIQKEAYNEAIKDAVKNAKTMSRWDKNDWYDRVDTDSILKLLKP